MAETKSNLAKAVIKVMQEVKGIEKNLTVGSSNFSYKGVADQDVKRIIGGAMAKHGLIILPTDIEETTIITEKLSKSPQALTKVKTKYLLMHESGESVELAGFGHGMDRGDKAPGKATTYALKYTLLYAFLVPTGSIDDTDTVHSDELTQNKQKAINKATQGLERPTEALVY